MRLQNIRLQGFRRFEEPTNINISNKLVSIVGTNEAGKTSILKAIEYMSGDHEIIHSDRTQLADTETKITMTFVVELGDEPDLNVKAGSKLHVTKKEDGERTYRAEPTPERDTRARVQLGRNILKCAKNRKLMKALTDASKEFDPNVLKEHANLLCTSIAKLDQDTFDEIQSFKSNLEKIDLEKYSDYISDIPAQIDSTREFETDHDPHQIAINALSDLVPQILFFSDEHKNINVPLDLSLLSHADPKIRQKLSRPLEPPRDCRRLQLLSRRSYYEQDHKQVFTGGSRTGDPHGAGAQTGLSIALGSGGVHFSEDRLLTADTA
ncbi:AAA family ATPase [Parasphingorhabdus sp. NYA22]